MKQYLNLLSNIKDNGVEKESGRAGMPNTKSLFGTMMKFDLSKGFPMVTTKKVSFKNIVVELLWFLNGGTNIKYLVDNGCNIWNKDAHRWYLQNTEEESRKAIGVETLEEYVNAIKTDVKFAEEFGELGRVYGAQWRDWTSKVQTAIHLGGDGKREDGGSEHVNQVYQNVDRNESIDQIKTLIQDLRSNPMSRRHIITAWNPAELELMALPPCHAFMQFDATPLNTTQRIELVGDYEKREKLYSMDGVDVEEVLDNSLNIPKFKLNCNMYQRSCDTFLGVPYNIASYSLLTHIISKYVNMEPGVFTWMGGDTHIYMDHLEGVDMQLSREVRPLPVLVCDVASKELNELSFSDFKLLGYDPHPAIGAELSVGI